MKRIELKAVPHQIFIDKEDALIGKVSYLAGWDDGLTPSFKPTNNILTFY